MSLDAARMKKRRNLMMALNAAAVLAALAAITAYFRLAEPLALVAFGLALAVGFGAQIWFIAGLRRTKGDV